MADWDNNLILKFLNLYESERLLWDSKNKNHKLKHKVHDAWKRISVNMDNIPIEELKGKRRSLMATFRPLLKKKKTSIRSGAGADDVFQPIWFAFDVMENFLGTIYDVEETINTENELQESETTMPLPSSSSIQSLPSNDIPPPASTQGSTKKTDPKTNISRKRPNTTDLYLDEAQKKISESFDTLNHVLKGKKAEDDECDVYGKLLAKKLRKYPGRMRDLMMYKIDGLLLDNPYHEDRPLSACSYYSTQSPSPSINLIPVTSLSPEEMNGPYINAPGENNMNFNMQTHPPQSPEESSIYENL